MTRRRGFGPMNPGGAMHAGSDFIDLIYDAALEPALWNNVLRALGDCVGGNCGWISQINKVDGSGANAEDWVYGIDPVARTAYAEHFFRLNPFGTNTASMRHWTPSISTFESEMPRETLRRGGATGVRHSGRRAGGRPRWRLARGRLQLGDQHRHRPQPDVHRDVCDERRTDGRAGPYRAVRAGSGHLRRRRLGAEVASGRPVRDLRDRLGDPEQSRLHRREQARRDHARARPLGVKARSSSREATT